MISLDGKVEKVVLLTGTACDLKCSYCIQSESNICRESIGVNNATIYFLLSLAKMSNKRLSLVFYGGEPLLYWDNISYVLSLLGNCYDYRIVTNGRLLDDDKITTINDYGIDVHLSWDGQKSKITRGYDVIKDNLSNVMKIKKLGINSVITHFSSLRDCISGADYVNGLYYKKEKQNIGFNAICVKPVKSQKNIVYDIDLSRLSKDVDYYCRSFFSNKIDSPVGNIYVNKYWHMYLKFMKNYQGKFDLRFRHCNYEKMSVSMDFAGNLYSCPNTCNIISNINKDYNEYYQKIMESDCSSSHFEKCKSCKVLPLCGYGCRLLKDNQDCQNSFCKTNFVLFNSFLYWFNRQNLW